MLYDYFCSRKWYKDYLSEILEIIVIDDTKLWWRYYILVCVNRYDKKLKYWVFFIKNDNVRGHIFSIYSSLIFLLSFIRKYISVFMLILEYINYACLFLSLYLSLYISSRLFKISYDLTSIFLFNTYQIDAKTMYNQKYIFISF